MSAALPYPFGFVAIHIVIGEPISLEGKTRRDIPDLMAATRERLCAQLAVRGRFEWIDEFKHMAVSEDEVQYIASLARLRFSDEAVERLAKEMSEILAYVEKLNELDTTAVPPMSHVLDLYNVAREDRVEQRITREEALRNAPDADSEYFRAPKVIE